MDTKKQQFAMTMQSLATRLAIVLREASDATSTYFDRGYAGGASNQLEDVDFEGMAYAVTAEQMTSMVNMLDNLTKFMNGQTAAAGDYMPSINNIRTDQ